MTDRFHSLHSLALCCAVGTGLMLGVLSSAQAGCGVSFKKPETHFDGVNEFGYVSYWDQIGELTLDEGVVIPLVIGFRSDWEYTSPYLGKGWFLGLLDARIVQTGENSFDMIQPDGYTLPFGRDGENPSILHGAKGWKAQIEDDTITAHASCGWALTFERGMLTEVVTPNDRSLRIARDPSGAAREVRDKSGPLLVVNRDAAGDVSGLRVGNKTIEFEQTTRPQIAKVGGKSVVGPQAPAIGEIRDDSGVISSFEYSTDELREEKLSIESPEADPREFTWRADDKMILSDNEWNYTITPSEYEGGNAAIRRASDSGSEDWYYNSAAGTEAKTLNSSGLKQVIYKFTTGPLSGKPRQTVLTQDGRDILQKIYTYNEHGSLRRVALHDKQSGRSCNLEEYAYDGSGRLVRKVGTEIMGFTRHYTEGGSHVDKHKDGSYVEYFPLESSAHSVAALSLSKESDDISLPELLRGSIRISVTAGSKLVDVFSESGAHLYQTRIVKTSE